MTILSWVFILMTAAVGAVRTVVELTMVEADTGFYSSQNGWVFAQNLLYIAAVALPALLLIRSPRRFSLHFWARSRILGAVLCAAGITLGVSGMGSLGTDSMAFSRGVAGQSLLLLIAKAAGVAAAAFMIFSGIRLFASGDYRWGLWSGGVCALWMTADVIAHFMAYPTIANISDQMLEVVTLCMGALFWLSHARMVSEDGMETSARGAKLRALLFALFALTTGASQLIAALGTGGAQVLMDIPRQILFILLGVYAAVWSGAVKLEAHASDAPRADPQPRGKE